MFVKITLGVIGAFLGYHLISAYTDPSEEAVFARLFSTLASGIFLGLLAIFYVLPALSQKAAMSMYSDSGEEAEPDILKEARAFVAQGEYDQAVVAYRQALEKEPDNRLGWTDMAKLYVEKLEQPDLAVASLREGIDGHEWEEEDGAFLLFRLSEWQLDDCDDQEAGAASLTEVMEKYPSTRHSANAMQQLRDLGYDVEVEVLDEAVESTEDEEESMDPKPVSSIPRPDNLD